MQLMIDLGQSPRLIDDLGIIADCYAAVDDLLTGVHIQERERERIATLLNVLGTLQRGAIDHLRQTGTERLAAVEEGLRVCVCA
ncbi:hypothetical protein [Thiocystis violascens]|uniref:Uncharacterized protein n=1 Tax=Thiocystis violascens (strain ATCC 17096 / DSM 198 / 6111) TaxID=765911 RepID=I3YGU7_THIV6|nr:hypothetical protein [Thiocystis violascens]AFL76215.1 hypothetical protein Thivi_4412 [Thiocystis violascens DSM 198]